MKRRPLVAWSPHSGNHLVLGSQDVRLYELDPPPPGTDLSASRQRSFHIKDVIADAPALTCMTWSANPATPLDLAVGLSSGPVLLTSFGSESSGVLKSFVPRHPRQVNALDWNPVYPHLVAAGMEKIRTDHGALIWDVNAKAVPAEASAQSTTTAVVTVTKDIVNTPLHRLSSSECIPALSWLPAYGPGGGYALAVGTGYKWLRVYDVRNEAQPLSVVAHTKSVNGVEVDPLAPHCLATFSDDGVVKVWDMRNLASAVVCIRPRARTLTQIAWCPTRPGLLATIAQSENWISMWDIRKPYAEAPRAASTTPLADGSGGIAGADNAVVVSSPTRKRFCQSAPACISWEPWRTGSVKPHRMLTVNWSGQVEDISTMESAPVSFSPAGNVCFATGPRSFSCDMSKLVTASHVPDMGTRMRVRLSMGYSLDIARNRAIFSEAASRARAKLQAFGSDVTESWLAPSEFEFEEDLYGGEDALLVPNHSLFGSGESSLASMAEDARARYGSAVDQLFESHRLYQGLRQLRAMWEFMEQVSGKSGDLSVGSFMGVCAVLDSERNLEHVALNGESADNPEAPVAPIGAFVGYSSPARLAALKLCGWLPDNETVTADLAGVLDRCQQGGRYDRAAALAVWHGCFREAVQSLQSATAVHGGGFAYNNHAGRGQGHADVEALNLVAVALAGFQAGAGSDSAMTSLWRETCNDLRIRMGRRHPYLRGVCAFLYAHTGGVLPVDGDSDPNNKHKLWMKSKYAHILADKGIALSDRVAFACRFLPDDQLWSFVEASALSCVAAGRLDGLLLTGLRARGVSLLQGYVDSSGDVQTAALVGCFCHGEALSGAQARRAVGWISSYREVLNVWQLWQERAKFDVGRTKLRKRLLSLTDTSTRPTSLMGGRKGLNRMLQDSHSVISSVTGGSELDLDTETGTKVLFRSIPVASQLHIKCHACNKSLSLPNLVQTSTAALQFLTAQSPKMLACPSCRKRLPRCSLCLLGMGSINPYLEIHNQLKQKARRVGEEVEETESGVANSVPFADWWTWCQTCRHGGHAMHLAEWFADHSTCPVASCGCRCALNDNVQPLPSDLIADVSSMVAPELRGRGGSSASLVSFTDIPGPSALHRQFSDASVTATLETKDDSDAPVPSTPARFSSGTTPAAVGGATPVAAPPQRRLPVAAFGYL